MGDRHGKPEEAAVLLTRLLTRRFATVSAETRERINVAPVEQIEDWCERVLDAESLDEVFEAP